MGDPWVTQTQWTWVWCLPNPGMGWPLGPVGVPGEYTNQHCWFKDHNQFFYYPCNTEGKSLIKVSAEWLQEAPSNYEPHSNSDSEPEQPQQEQRIKDPQLQEDQQEQKTKE